MAVVWHRPDGHAGTVGGWQRRSQAQQVRRQEADRKVFPGLALARNCTSPLITIYALKSAFITQQTIIDRIQSIMNIIMNVHNSGVVAEKKSFFKIYLSICALYV